ncbi:MAG: DUF4430 domain-containing protein [Clostridia bacterium]|nr:DUF4430 domain-containing protein [Clostridia bacterium]
MKKTMRFIGRILLSMMLCLCFSACTQQAEPANLWDSAVYTEDVELGSGETTVLVEVKALDKAVTFTLNTDRKTLGEALTEHELVAGEEGAYGLYVKVVNGITADYDINKSYWALTKNGEYMQTGVDKTEITDGERFELTYTKQ